MEYIYLNNGVAMPLLGTGTNSYGKEGNDWANPLHGDYSDFASAIDAGFRKIDAAIMYKNEEGIGQTLVDSGLGRDEFFITSKLPHTEDFTHSKEAVRQALDQSLANCQTDYLDLYLLHFPVESDHGLENVVEILEDYYRAGKFKAIGISNHDRKDYQRYMSVATIQPAVNQIQVNLETKNEDLVDFFRQEGVQVEAWGPMNATEDQQAILEGIGQAYGKTWGQVLLRYQIQRGISVIPKSHSRSNQEKNLDIFDFTLSDEDMRQIADL